MRVAAFKDEPNATVAASILTDQGYETEIVQLGGGVFNPRVSDLVEAIRAAAWANIFLVSNCELDHFERTVVENFGQVVSTNNRGYRMAS
jgi:hypothetical protein